VTELVPSGLAPIGAESHWFDPNNEEKPWANNARASGK